MLCADQAADYLAELDDLHARWMDALEIADSTARISLAGPVGELQAIRREIGALVGPECAAMAGVALYMHADAVIEGFLLFMQDEPESRVSAKFDEAFDALEMYNDTRDEIAAEVAQATRAAEATATPVAD